MKKALFFLAVLCVAGIFSAKAQSSSDSSFVRDLACTYINTGSLPYSNNGNVSLSNGGKYLKDVRIGCRAVGYAFTLSSNKILDIFLAPTSNWNSYLYVLDSAYNVVVYNNDYNTNNSYAGSRIIQKFSAGQYYILAVEQNSSTASRGFTLTVDELPALVTESTISYSNLTIGNSVTDSLRTVGGPLGILNTPSDSIQFMWARYARAYTIQVNNTGILTAYTDRSNRKVYLLDNNYEPEYSYDRENSYIQSNITTPGTYHIIVTSNTYFVNDTSVATLFTLSTQFNTTVDYNTMSYRNINVNDTVRDSLVESDPYLRNTQKYVKGYHIQTPANAQYLDFKVFDGDEDDYDEFIILLDANYNVIGSNDDFHWTSSHNGSRITRIVQPSSNYYLIVTSYSSRTTGDFKLYAEVPTTMPTYYIDNINGNDSRNGLTASTAVRTLDTAIARSQGIGLYYLTENYTFSGNSNLYLICAKVYPYQKDIRLYMPTTGNYSMLSLYEGGNSIVFGEQGSNYYFIIDSNRSSHIGQIIDGEYNITYVEVNNLKIKNSYLPNRAFYANNLVIRNCEFTNDSLNEGLAYINDRDGSFEILNTTIDRCASYEDFINLRYENSPLTIENSTISNNRLHDVFIEFHHDSGYFSFTNSTFVGNTLLYPVTFYSSHVDLNSGSWRNNTATYTAMNGNANVSANNMGGIIIYASKLNFGTGFSMDANNYLWVDSLSEVKISGNITSNMAAQLYPWKLNSSGNTAIADYYEGRRVLCGTSNLLANNYQKFSIAQADNSSLWYLHPDGTIHTWPIGIDQAEEGAISLYPNPANNVLNIALQGTEVNEVVLIDIYGKTVARTTVAEGNNTLDISALPAGMYFVQLRANNNVKATQKIVKN